MKFTEGIYPDIPEDEYHASRDSLSSTGAKTILRSPKQFRYEQLHPKKAQALDIGSLTHALVLSQPHSFCVKDWDGRTREGKARAEEAEANGLVPIAQADWDLAHGMADAVRSNTMADELLSHGRAEVSAYAVDPDTGVNLRGRFDYLRDDGTIIDLKTARNSEPGGWARDGATWKVHLQAAHYWRIAELLGLDPPHFYFIVVEKDAPYLVSLIELDTDSMRAGYQLCDIAYQVYRDCMAVDLWPDWFATTDEIVTVSIPQWAIQHAYSVQE